MKIAALFALAWALSAQADSQKPLRWAADTESGAPFVFTDPANPDRLIGFEKDIVDAIARDLGREPQFVQNAWDGLVQGLISRDQYDLIINGIEITEDRRKEILFSDPYFVTFEQLAVRAGEGTIDSLSDCKGKKVGTLKFSLAERILAEEGGIEVVSYEAETNAYEDLKHGRTVAVLLDAPIAQYYAKPDPALKLVGPPIGQVIYGIGFRKKDAALKTEVDAALKRLVRSGELRRIYDRWNLWTPSLAAFFQDSTATRTPPSEYERFLAQNGQSRSWKDRAKLYLTFLPILAKAAITTLEISIAAMLLAIALGLALALGRLYGPAPISTLVVGWIELIRGTPLLIQLFFIFYALPHLGLQLSPWVAAVLGLGINYAASEAENYRAGLQTVPRAQTEAALALGLDPWQSLRHVVLPQAFRIALPPVTNDFIALLKDSSLVSVITMVELTKTYGQLASTYYDFIGTGILVAGFYLLIGWPFVRLSRRLEQKLQPYLAKGWRGGF